MEINVTPSESPDTPFPADLQKKRRNLRQRRKRKAAGALLLRVLPFFIAATLVIVGGVALFREASHFSIHEIKQALQALPPSALLKAGGATLLAYFLLSFYDYFGAWYAKDPQPWFKSALAAFCSYVLAHNLGCTALSGAAVRYRLYRAWGMSAADIARMIIFCTWACGLGVFFLTGIALLAQPNALPIPWITSVVTITAGMICLGIVIVYLILSIRGGKLKIRSWELVMPSPLLAFGQLAVSALDMGVTALILWCVLGQPQHTTLPDLTFLGFVGLYLMAYLAGLLSTVPGGVGVFDAFLLTMLLPWFPAPQVIGGLVIFRSFYYLIPLILAGMLFAGHELFLKFSRHKNETLPSQEGIHFAEGDFTTQIGAFVQTIFGLGLAAYALLGLPGQNSISLLNIAIFFLGALIAGLAFSIGQKVFAGWRASVIVLTLLLPILLYAQAEWIVFFSDCLVLLIVVPFRRYYYREAHIVAFPNIPATIASFLLVMGILGGTAWAALERRSGEFLWLPKDATSIALTVAALIFTAAIFFAFRRTRIHFLFWNDETVVAKYALGDFIPEGYIVESSGRAWNPCTYVDLKWDNRVLLVLGSPYGDKKYFSAIVWRMRDFAIQEGIGLAWLIPRNANWKNGETLLKNLGLDSVVWQDNWLLYAWPSQISILLHYLDIQGYSNKGIGTDKVAEQE